MASLNADFPVHPDSFAVSWAAGQHSTADITSLHSARPSVFACPAYLDLFNFLEWGILNNAHVPLRIVTYFNPLLPARQHLFYDVFLAALAAMLSGSMPECFGRLLPPFSAYCYEPCSQLWRPRAEADRGCTSSQCSKVSGCSMT